MPEPSPWLEHYDPKIKPHASAGFTEYLRWMRLSDVEFADQLQTKVLEAASKGAGGYKERYELRNAALDEILGVMASRFAWLKDEGNNLKLKDVTFTATCDGRVRVGGIRGPESVLLPAFDALGMPYLPSATLRGVARAAAQQQNVTNLAHYFGDLDAPEADQMGKVIFFDAYPVGKLWQSRGLSLDIANNIWGWDNNSLSYSPNPNVFLSLKNVTFKIALCPTPHCDQGMFEQVKGWLIEGLQQGIGAQVNSGYGVMTVKGVTTRSTSLVIPEIKFKLEGQLIHSYQRLAWNQRQEKWDSTPEAEARAIAFKSMMRYWFRVLSLGFINSKQVQSVWEPRLFGGIKPQTWGWLQFNLSGLRSSGSTQSGKLEICFSPEGLQQNNATQADVKALLQHLAWLMFHLAGVGQGARRPLYARQSNPRVRGSSLTASSGFSSTPNNFQGWHHRLRVELKGFYDALIAIAGQFTYQNLSPYRARFNVKGDEYFRSDCKVLLCAGAKKHPSKCFALDVLHQMARYGDGKYDSELCGDSNSNPLPIIIKDLGDYQVVTVYGCSNQKRRDFLRELQHQSTPKQFEILWDETGLV